VTENRTLPTPPPWRTFKGVVPSDFAVPPIAPDSRDQQRASTYCVDASPADGEKARWGEIEMVNAALYLGRPLLITGKPGTGKSSLAYSVAAELELGPVLYWPISTRSTLLEGLYRYDAIGRLQASKDTDSGEPSDIEAYIELGPLGTALLPSNTPRVLLIDEIDKGDIDLPNDLLNIFEEGRFEIPELARLPKSQSIKSIRVWKDHQRIHIESGQVECSSFPLVLMTSNGERDFPGPFLRRCLRLEIPEPDQAKLEQIVNAHFARLPKEKRKVLEARRDALITAYLLQRNKGDLATDQLLNAVHIALRAALSGDEDEKMKTALWRYLSEG
jgi:MoxR-like ATPase